MTDRETIAETAKQAGYREIANSMKVGLFRRGQYWLKFVWGDDGTVLFAEQTRSVRGPSLDPEQKRDRVLGWLIDDQQKQGSSS